MSIPFDGATPQHTAYRVTGLPHEAAGLAEFSDTVTYSGRVDEQGAPVYRSAVTGMTASISPSPFGGDVVRIIDWPGHDRAEIEQTATTATPLP